MENAHISLDDILSGHISADEVIDEWTLSTRILHQNFSFLKSFDPTRIAVPCIRNGHIFLEVFLKQVEMGKIDFEVEKLGTRNIHIEFYQN